MSDTLHKSFSFGVGAFALTKEKIEQVVQELIEKGEVSREESPKLIKNLIARAEEEKQALDSRIEAAQERALHRLGVITRKDFEKLDRKLDELLAKTRKESQ